MSNEEKDTIKIQLDKHHQAIMKRMDDFDEQIKPIVRIYKTAEGFGISVFWIAKYIITPIIVLLGAILSIKKLTE